jgi:DNA repair protein RadC
MRIIQYDVQLNKEDRLPTLTTVGKYNFPDIEQITTSAGVRDIFLRIFHADSLPEEHLWVLAMDSKCGKCTPLRVFETGHGTATNSLVSPRSVFLRLCLLGATHFILIHNHPSGDPCPSSDDIEITKVMVDAGKLMGIPMMDHIIIGDGTFISMRELGYMILDKT